MGLPPVGSIVLLPFPYADLSRHKNRPALVVAHAEYGNLIVCQITSNPSSSKRTVRVSLEDFVSGDLKLTSYVRPDKIFTLDPHLIKAILGTLTTKKQKEISASLVDLFT